MAEITKELGRIPVSRGDYQATTEYYKDNIVQYKRSSYQVVSESPIIGIPPINDEDIVNNGWIIFAGTLPEASLIKSNTQDLSGNNVQENLNSAAEKLKELKLESIYDVSAHNNGKVFESLSAILSRSDLDALIPTSIRHGGMSIRFIQSSDNKYVQYRLMADSFSTSESDWQGVDDEPTAGSKNLVDSEGIDNALKFSKVAQSFDNTAFSNNGYYDTSGVYHNDNSIEMTDSIDITNYSRLEFKGRLSSAGLCVVVYDDNNTMLLNLSIPGVDNNSMIFDKIISLDRIRNAGGKYIKLCSITSYAELGYILYTKDVKEFFKQNKVVVNELTNDENIAPSSKVVKESLAFSKESQTGDISKFSNNGYYYIDGTYDGDTVIGLTDRIDISDAIAIRFKGRLNATAYCIAVFDTNDSIMTSLSIPGTNDNSYIFDINVDLLTIKNGGGKYIRMSSIKTYSETSYTITVDAVKDFLLQDKIVINEITESENQAVSSKVIKQQIDNETEEKFASVNDNIFKIKAEIGFPGKYINSSGNLTSETSTDTTSFIYVSGVKSISTYVKDTDNRNIAFYDRGKNFISGTFANNIHTNNVDEPIIITVPPSAYFFRMTYKYRESNDRYLTLLKNNEITRIKTSAFSHIYKFGVVGDSLSVGYIASGTYEQNVRNIKFCWGQYIARRNGNYCLNFGRSGATTATWFTYNECYNTLIQPDNKCQVYIIGIGTNDIISSAAELGSLSDIDVSDYHNNANTFYGRYAKIIQVIKEFASTAKIICFTIPNPREDVDKNTAIREICGLSGLGSGIYLCDLEGSYNDLFEDKIITNEYFGDHFSALGYELCSQIIEQAVSDIILQHSNDFRNINIIPFGNNTIID